MNELQALKDIAADLGITHSPNIGLETLKNKIVEHCMEHNLDVEELFTKAGLEYTHTSNQDETMKASKMTNHIEDKVSKSEPSKNRDLIEKLRHTTFAKVAQDQAMTRQIEVHHKAMKLIRCRVTCNNPNKRNYTGDIFCARNAVIPEVKKFIPFNVPTHIPQILYNMLKEKQLQQFVSEKLPNGNQVKRSKLVPEYNIEVLDPLTPEEFNAIKQRQLAEGK